MVTVSKKKMCHTPGSGVASVVVTVVTAPVACAEVTVVVIVGMLKKVVSGLASSVEVSLPIASRNFKSRRENRHAFDAGW